MMESSMESVTNVVLMTTTCSCQAGLGFSCTTHHCPNIACNVIKLYICVQLLKNSMNSLSFNVSQGELIKKEDQCCPVCGKHIYM